MEKHTGAAEISAAFFDPCETVDGIMVSNVGPAAISAISLVDAINILVIQAFNALAAGGMIICSQYIGQEDRENANESARQLVVVVAMLSLAVTSNGLNIIGNLILIWGFGLGVAGAAIATLGARLFSAAVVFLCLRNREQLLVIRNYASIRPDGKRIRSILALGIPNGIENSMFQFGKLVIQSTVSTMGTTAIAAQAMTCMLENLNEIGGLGIGIGMMTVVGQCIGAGRKEDAVYYVKKLTIWANLVIAAGCVLVYFLTKPITILAGMEPESASLCLYMMGVDYAGQILCLDAGLCDGLRPQGCGGCPFFHAYLLRHHVGISRQPQYLLKPYVGDGPDGGVDWYVCGLDCAGCYLQLAVCQPALAAASGGIRKDGAFIGLEIESITVNYARYGKFVLL